MRRMLAIGALVAGLGAVAWYRSASAPPSAEELAAITRTSDIYSDVFTIDRKYRSMMGPTAVVEGSLGDADPPELLWVTGYRAIMVEADGDREMPQDFMCHANMNL